MSHQPQGQRWVGSSLQGSPGHSIWCTTRTCRVTSCRPAWPVSVMASCTSAGSPRTFLPCASSIQLPRQQNIYSVRLCLRTNPGQRKDANLPSYAVGKGHLKWSYHHRHLPHPQCWPIHAFLFPSFLQDPQRLCCHSHLDMPLPLQHHCASASRKQCACATPSAARRSGTSPASDWTWQTAGHSRWLHRWHHPQQPLQPLLRHLVEIPSLAWCKYPARRSCCRPGWCFEDLSWSRCTGVGWSKSESCPSWTGLHRSWCIPWRHANHQIEQPGWSHSKDEVVP